MIILLSILSIWLLCSFITWSVIKLIDQVSTAKFSRYDYYWILLGPFGILYVLVYAITIYIYESTK